MRTRIRIISVCFLLFSLLLVGKLYSVQIIHNQDFLDRADRQYQQPTDAFDRGTIYFSDKDGNLISAATLKTGFLVTINPKVMQQANDIADAYTKISALLPSLDHDDFFTKASKPNDTYEEVAKQVDDDVGTKIDALHLQGVSLYQEKWRYYPGGSLAAHVLGFMGYQGNTLAGRYGLESSYDSTLSRSDDGVYVNFFAQIFSNFKKTVVDGQSMEGDIVTSIEPRTQAYVESMIKSVNAEYSSEKTGAIIMDPKTGAIYAMAMYPTFDPNDFKDVTDPSVFTNDLVEGVREMGSIIKPFTMSAGIDLGEVSASTTYDDKGFVTANGKTIYNFDKVGRGVITLQTALSQSLNTGFAYVTSVIGDKALATYFRRFGFGEKTGIDLPNEATGLIDNLNSPRDIEYYTASFGQGIAMSPIEVIRGYSAIANQGKMVTPHVVTQINYRLGISKAPSLPPDVQVISPATANAVTTMMIYNVDNALLQGKASDPHYSVAAKTGTAQIAINGTYSPDKFLHSFVGYLPARDPKFLVFIYTINPKGVAFASETLAQPFIDLTKFLINYYQLQPDR